MIGPGRLFTLFLRATRGGDDGNDSGGVDLSSVPTDTLRSNLFDMLTSNPGGHLDATVREAFSSALAEYANREDRLQKDVLFSIGSSVFGIDVNFPPPPKDDEEEEIIVSFDYMKGFMKDVFLSYGVPEDRAEICADVLIESDRRGIDSHGLGRLKPIYCDRMDQGILEPSMPIDVVKETETTALLDGNLGIGLYIGPYCMQLAIEKAKKHGVGFVVVRNSTHYGIAGYYVTMATAQGCIGWSGTNARPSIAPTFGVEVCQRLAVEENF